MEIFNGMSVEDKFILLLKALGLIWLLFQTKKIYALIRESFGKIHKAELCSMIFTPVLIWMLVGEHGRKHEWNWFSEFKFGTVALIVMYGFGLKPIINAFLMVKGIDPKVLSDKEDDEDKNLKKNNL